MIPDRLYTPPSHFTVRKLAPSIRYGAARAMSPEYPVAQSQKSIFKNAFKAFQDWYSGVHHKIPSIKKGQPKYIAHYFDHFSLWPAENPLKNALLRKEQSLGVAFTQKAVEDLKAWARDINGGEPDNYLQNLTMGLLTTRLLEKTIPDFLMQIDSPEAWTVGLSLLKPNAAHGYTNGIRTHFHHSPQNLEMLTQFSKPLIQAILSKKEWGQKATQSITKQCIQIFRDMWWASESSSHNRTVSAYHKALVTDMLPRLIQGLSNPSEIEPAFQMFYLVFNNIRHNEKSSVWKLPPGSRESQSPAELTVDIPGMILNILKNHPQRLKTFQFLKRIMQSGYWSDFYKDYLLQTTLLNPQLHHQLSETRLAGINQLLSLLMPELGNTTFNNSGNSRNSLYFESCQKILNHAALPISDSVWQQFNQAIIENAQQETNWQGRKNVILEGIRQTVIDFLPRLLLSDTPDRYRLVNSIGEKLVKERDVDALLRILPMLINPQIPEGIDFARGIADEINRLNINHEWDYGVGMTDHPFETELMLMIRPLQLTQDYEGIDRFMLAITGLTGFKTAPSNLVAKTWSDIGFLSHAFKLWKYDAQRGQDQQTLLNKFGFKTIENREETTDKRYGRGCEISKALRPSLNLDEKTWIEFRQGYLAVFHPEKGLLVIRNSSPHFGRNLMTHTAYYASPTSGITLSDLKHLNPATDNRLQPILTPSLYDNPNFEQDLTFLTKSLLTVKSAYGKWKLDTEKFDSDGNFTGHQSPGFKALTRKLLYLAREKEAGRYHKSLPNLAFSSPEMPPFDFYAFQSAHSDEHLERFELTPEHLKEMKDLATGRWNDSQYPQSDWIRFLQAGLDAHAELILVDPEIA